MRYSDFSSVPLTEEISKITIPENLFEDRGSTYGLGNIKITTFTDTFTVKRPKERSEERNKSYRSFLRASGQEFMARLIKRVPFRLDLVKNVSSITTYGNKIDTSQDYWFIFDSEYTPAFLLGFYSYYYQVIPSKEEALELFSTNDVKVSPKELKIFQEKKAIRPDGEETINENVDSVFPVTKNQPEVRGHAFKNTNNNYNVDDLINLKSIRGGAGAGKLLRLKIRVSSLLLDDVLVGGEEDKGDPNYGEISEIVFPMAMAIRMIFTEPDKEELSESEYIKHYREILYYIIKNSVTYSSKIEKAVWNAALTLSSTSDEGERITKVEELAPGAKPQGDMLRQIKLEVEQSKRAFAYIRRPATYQDQEFKNILHQSIYVARNSTWLSSKINALKAKNDIDDSYFVKSVNIKVLGYSDVRSNKADISVSFSNENGEIKNVKFDISLKRGSSILHNTTASHNIFNVLGNFFAPEVSGLKYEKYSLPNMNRENLQESVDSGSLLEKGNLGQNLLSSLGFDTRNFDKIITILSQPGAKTQKGEDKIEKAIVMSKNEEFRQMLKILKNKDTGSITSSDLIHDISTHIVSQAREQLSNDKNLQAAFAENIMKMITNAATRGSNKASVVDLENVNNEEGSPVKVYNYSRLSSDAFDKKNILVTLSNQISRFTKEPAGGSRPASIKIATEVGSSNESSTYNIIFQAETENGKERLLEVNITNNPKAETTSTKLKTTPFTKFITQEEDNASSDEARQRFIDFNKEMSDSAPIELKEFDDWNINLSIGRRTTRSVNFKNGYEDAEKYVTQILENVIKKANETSEPEDEEDKDIHLNSLLASAFGIGEIKAGTKTSVKKEVFPSTEKFKHFYDYNGGINTENISGAPGDVDISGGNKNIKKYKQLYLLGYRYGQAMTIGKILGELNLDENTYTVPIKDVYENIENADRRHGVIYSQKKSEEERKRRYGYRETILNTLVQGYRKGDSKYAEMLGTVPKSDTKDKIYKTASETKSDNISSKISYNDKGIVFNDTVAKPSMKLIYKQANGSPATLKKIYGDLVENWDKYVEGIKLEEDDEATNSILENIDDEDGGFDDSDVDDTPVSSQPRYNKDNKKEYVSYIIQNKPELLNTVNTLPLQVEVETETGEKQIISVSTTFRNQILGRIIIKYFAERIKDLVSSNQEANAEFKNIMTEAAAASTKRNEKLASFIVKYLS